MPEQDPSIPLDQLNQGQGVETPAEVQNFKMDLAGQIALYENGLSRYLTEIDVIRAFRLKRSEYDQYKQNLRADIDRIKEKHQYGKYLIMQNILGKLALSDSIMKSAMHGDHKNVNNLREILDTINDAVPVDYLKDCAEVLEKVGVPSSASKSSSVNVQINNGAQSPSVVKAEEALKALDNKKP